MKISEYPSIGVAEGTANFILDSANGTKKINVNDLRYALFDAVHEMHNQMFRGYNLGTSITPEQFNRISSGDFSGLWLGDYWMLGGNKWVIIDFDYAFNAGLNEHHIVLMQMSGNESRSLHGDVINNAGYGRLKAHVVDLPNIAKSVKNLVGASHVRALVTRYAWDFSNDLHTGAFNHKDTMDEAWLPSQIQILGARVHKNARWNVAGQTDATNQSRQFAYFRMAGHSMPDGLGTDHMWTSDQTFGTSHVCIHGSSGVVYDAPRNSIYKFFPYVFIS